MEKLNKALAEMDTLENVSFIKSSKENSVTIDFNCLDGGHYEDVTLSIKFHCPISVHLPCYYYGTFSLFSCSDVEHKLMVPESTYDEFQSCFHLQVKPDSKEFYIQCDELEWELTGKAGIIKSKHEFYEYGL